jgi:hypothetical protein
VSSFIDIYYFVAVKEEFYKNFYCPTENSPNTIDL